MSECGKPVLVHLRYQRFPSIRCHLQEGRQGTIQRHSFIRMSKMPMSGAGTLRYPAMRNRKNCMRSMKQQTAAIGQSLRNAISRNFRKAAQKENVSRRGNLSLPCPNPFPIFMSQTNCYGCSQTALRKSMAWNA